MFMRQACLAIGLLFVGCLSAHAQPSSVPSVTPVKPAKSVKSVKPTVDADQVPLPMFVSQSLDDPSPTASVIPPVVTGTVDLEELKRVNLIDLKVAQSRTFRFKNKIIRTSVSDSGIAEAIVISETQMVLLGKSAGTSTLVLWDDAGNCVSLDLRVTRDYNDLQKTLREIDPRIIVKAFSVGGSDRVLLLGEVDHPESIAKAFSAANVFLDDRGMNINVANSRLINARVGEQGGTSAGGAGGGGQLAQLASVDKYTYFSNLSNNISKAQVMVSDGGRVTSLVKVRKVPLIALHCSFMEMNTTAARELGVMLGFSSTSKSFAFGVGGTNTSGSYVLTAAKASPGTSTSNLTPVTFTSSNTTSTGASVSGIGQGVLVSASSLLSQAVLFGSPGGASFQNSGLGNVFTSIASMQKGSWSGSISPVVQGLISQQRARVLSEPTVVTISGERASLLAGGEIPILQSIATAGTRSSPCRSNLLACVST
jgi:Flp pilus assembly secretin CpaC